MNQTTLPATPLHDVVTRPILFSGPMVRALLDGRKTQTRRIVKAKDSDPSRCITLPMLMQGVYEWRQQDGRWFGIEGYDTLVFCDCPYGQVGERLWVRETFCRSRNNTFYRCDGANSKFKPNELSEEWDWDRGCGEKWTPSIHMNRHYSRITLEITGVRIERLNAISEADAVAEGTDFGLDALGRRFLHPIDRTGLSTFKPCRDGYQKLWESINGEGSWAANPWVWVVEFKVV